MRNHNHEQNSVYAHLLVNVHLYKCYQFAFTIFIIFVHAYTYTKGCFDVRENANGVV